MFSPRSGSSWLTSVLSATRKFGMPEEYINPDFLPDVVRATHARTPQQLLNMLMRLRKSPNNVFGIEAREVDITLFGFDAFRDTLGPETLYFHLWRDNLVAQGVSLFRAIATGRFHSDSAAAAAPAYDGPAILEWVRHVAATENANVRMLRALGVPARRLVYEEMIKDRETLLEQFAHALAVRFVPGEFAARAKGELSKVGDDWNEMAEQRLRAEYPDDVGALEAERLVKRGIAPPLHPPPPGPELLEAWRQGRDAGASGRSPRNNPFVPGSEDAAAWAGGWRLGWDGQIYLPA
jgi:LPS sulfotransferase NodH/ribosome modulation factor